MNDNGYHWRLQLHFSDDTSYEAMRRSTQALDAAIVDAAERMISESTDGATALQITSGGGSDVERRLTFKRSYQIAERPVAVDEETFTRAADAIEHLREIRDAVKHPDDCFTVIREPSGCFRVGSHARDACDFNTQEEADDALRGFHDPSRFCVLPLVEVTLQIANGS